MLKTYSINGSIRGSKHFGEVKAESAEAALKVAEDTLDIGASFCHQCNEECEDPEAVYLHAEHQNRDGTFETAEVDYDAPADVDELKAGLKTAAEQLAKIRTHVLKHKNSSTVARHILKLLEAK